MHLKCLKNEAVNLSKRDGDVGETYSVTQKEERTCVCFAREKERDVKGCEVEMRINYPKTKVCALLTSEI